MIMTKKKGITTMYKEKLRVFAQLCLVFTLLIASLTQGSLYLNAQGQTEIAAQNEEEEETALVLFKTEFNLVVGDSDVIEIDTEKSSVQTGALSFQSSNESVVEVSSQGENFGRMRAIGEGSATINITLRGNTEVLASVSVNVTPLQGDVSFVSPISFINRGASRPMQLQISDSLSHLPVVWTSSNDNVLKVDAEGNVNAVQVGTAIIKAQVGDFSVEQNIRVNAPLNKIDFNGESIELEVLATADIPSLIYVPYDTTDDKTPRYESSDESIFVVEGDTILAKTVGDAQLIAHVGSIQTTIDVTVTPSRNGNGAQVLYLNDFELIDGVMVFTTKQLEVYGDHPIALLFNEDIVLKYIADTSEPHIVVRMSDNLIDSDMKQLDSFMTYPKIFEALGSKDLSIRLEDESNQHVITYIFDSTLTDAVNLKHKIEEIAEDHKLYRLIQTKSFAIEFYNTGAGSFDVIVPGYRIASSTGQMHFVHTLKKEKLTDTGQHPVSDDNNEIQFTVKDDYYIVTFNSLNVITNKGLMMSLGAIALGLIVFGGYKAVKAYKNQDLL